MYRLAFALVVILTTCGASYSTPNFIIQCHDPQLARELGEAAERYRKELAQLWLGRTLPDWSRPCPVTVHVGPHLGAGGATTFVFDRGEVYGWKMTIQGSRERLFDSVLPHEVTHMILASHLRRPIPRWADEGAATTVEHISEREKHRRMLLEFLRTRRGIAFRHMFAMEEYPRDIMPLYAQGYALAEFLIQQGGHQKFVRFLEDGLKLQDWDAALAKYYPYQDLGALQLTWVDWVARGFPQLLPASTSGTPESQLAAVTSPSAEWRPRTASAETSPSIYQRLLASPLSGDITLTASQGGGPHSAGTPATIWGSPNESPQRNGGTPLLVDVTGWRPAQRAPQPVGRSGEVVAMSPTGGCGCGEQSVHPVPPQSGPGLSTQGGYPDSSVARPVLLEWTSPTVWR